MIGWRTNQIFKWFTLNCKKVYLKIEKKLRSNDGLGEIFAAGEPGKVQKNYKKYK